MECRFWFFQLRKFHFPEILWRGQKKMIEDLHLLSFLESGMSVLFFVSFVAEVLCVIGFFPVIIYCSRVFVDASIEFSYVFLGESIQTL